MNPHYHSGRQDTVSREDRVPCKERTVAKLDFPQGFLWGTIQSAYQIEGGWNEDGKGPSVWDEFAHTPGKILTGDTGDVACDHYHRYKEDVAIMRSMNLGAYAFSINWPRVIPEGKGQVNEKGFDFYDRLVDELIAAEIKPVIMLHHWELPLALHREGGWPNPDTAQWFGEYAAHCFRRLGDRVSMWATFNEPNLVAEGGYMYGVDAPGISDIPTGFRAAHTMLVAHGLAVQALRSSGRDGEIGIMLDAFPCHPQTDSEADRAAVPYAEAQKRRWFLDPIYFGDYPVLMRERLGDLLPEFTPEQRGIVTSPIDYIGENIYSRFLVRAAPEEPMGWDYGDRVLPATQMGWEIYPRAIRETANWLHETYSPPAVYVTENGAAFEDVPDETGYVDDEQRRAFLRDHLIEGHRAIGDGVPLKGWFVWALLDNFEWEFGYSRRFGLVRVDFETLKRTIKKSGKWYAEVARTNSVDSEET